MSTARTLPLAFALMISLSSVTHAKEKCVDLLQEVPPRDFPIEEYFPEVKIHSIERIPYNSLAFKVWRSRSAHDLPDVAFNWHYFTTDQQLRAAGFPTVVEARDPTQSIEHYFFAARVKYNHYHFYDSYRPKSDKSATALTPELIKHHKTMNAELKYIITTRGEVYIFDIDAVHEDIVFRAGSNDVLDVGYLDFIDGAIKVSGRNPSFESFRYMKDYINRLQAPQK